MVLTMRTANAWRQHPDLLLRNNVWRQLPGLGGAACIFASYVMWDTLIPRPHADHGHGEHGGAHGGAHGDAHGDDAHGDAHAPAAEHSGH